MDVDQALKKAFWEIKFPSMCILLGPILCFIVLAKLNVIPSVGNEGLAWFGPIFIFSFVGSWLLWSIRVPKWKLWAYQRVSNVQELKKKAISKQIIYPNSSVFTKTEIASKSVKAAIKKLERKK